MLRLVVGAEGGGGQQILDVSLYDSASRDLPAQAILLAVGALSAHEVAPIVDLAGRRGVSAVVVRSPGEVDETLRAAVARSGVPLLGAAEGVDWTQLVVLLRSLVQQGPMSMLARRHGSPPDDLFALADVVSARLNAPITIEDRQSKVMAFSGAQDRIDGTRIETILQRQVPVRFTEAYRRRGIFHELYRDARPLYIEPMAHELPRVAVPVVAGREVLGSIWATVTDAPTSSEEHDFVEAAKWIAPSILKHSVRADTARQQDRARLRAVLEAGPTAEKDFHELGLELPAVIWAIGRSAANAPQTGPVAVTEMQVLAAVAFNASALHPASRVTQLDGITYVAVPISTRTTDSESMAQTLATRLGSQFVARVGASRPVSDVSEFPAARRDADRALRVLTTGLATGAVGSITKLSVDALILELGDLATAKQHIPSGPISRLARYDQERGTDLLRTLRVWLDCFGDVQRAAAVMHVHKNTLRYRLRRAIEIGEINLESQSGHFALMIELRILDATASGAAAKSPPDRSRR